MLALHALTLSFRPWAPAYVGGAVTWEVYEGGLPLPVLRVSSELQSGGLGLRFDERNLRSGMVHKIKDRLLGYLHAPFVALRRLI